jgi:hypothetical protein
MVLSLHSSLVSFVVEFLQSFALMMVDVVGETGVVHPFALTLSTFIPFLLFIIVSLALTILQLLEQLMLQLLLFLIFIFPFQQRLQLLYRLLLASPSFSLAFPLLEVPMLELPQPIHKQQEFVTQLQLYQLPL